MKLRERVAATLRQIAASGETKQLRHLTSPVGPITTVEGIGEVVLLCSNDYLGLANHPEVVEAGREALARYGAGTASVRFISGTFDCHRRLESNLAHLVGTEAALTYVSCWSANEAILPTLCGPKDLILSDELNHASIIDAARAARGTKVSVFPHGDYEALASALADAHDYEIVWVVTDGVFSMEGDVADLARLTTMCNEVGAVLVVDDSHGVGVLGETGRGTPEHHQVVGHVEVLTGTLGKALGGAAGGYVASSSEVVDLLVQRSRPSLFSNALPTTVAAVADKAIEVMIREPDRLSRLRLNASRIRTGLREQGFDVPDGITGIIPVPVGETAAAVAMSSRLWELGVGIIGFGYPVVPEGQARLRIQASAALTAEHIDAALDAFRKL